MCLTCLCVSRYQVVYKRTELVSRRSFVLHRRFNALALLRPPAQQPSQPHKRDGHHLLAGSGTLFLWESDRALWLPCILSSVSRLCACASVVFLRCGGKVGAINDILIFDTTSSSCERAWQFRREKYGSMHRRKREQLEHRDSSVSISTA